MPHTNEAPDRVGPASASGNDVHAAKLNSPRDRHFSGDGKPRIDSKLELVARGLAAPNGVTVFDREFLRAVYGRGRTFPFERARLERLLRQIAIHLSAAPVPAGHSHEAHGPQPEPVAPPSAATAASQRPYVRERDDSYPDVVVRDGLLRVIICKDRLQWILQRRRESGRWIDLGYHRDRDALIKRCGMGAPAIKTLLALPPFHVGGAP